MHSEVAWVLVSSEAQVQPQIILVPDYLPDCLSVSYDYALMNVFYPYDNWQSMFFTQVYRNCGFFQAPCYCVSLKLVF